MKTQFLECEFCQVKGKSLFHFCPSHELEEMSGSKGYNQYKAGQTLFHEGSMPMGLFCVNKGKIKLHKMGSDGKEQIVRLVKPGDFIGYRALLSDTPYSASATAMEESSVCLVPKTTFLGLLRKNDNLADAMMKLICRNLEESEQKLTEMAYKPVRERLAEALVLLKTTYEDKSIPDAPPFSIAISREDLASLVGTAKETVIRILGEFKDDHLVRTEGRKIFVLEPVKLEKISKMYD